MRRYLWIGVAILSLAILASPAVLAGKGNGKGKPGDGGGGGEEPTPTTKRVALTGWQVKGGSRTGYPSLHTVGSDGSSLQRLTEGSQWADADWSPDGQYLVAHVTNSPMQLYHVGTGAQTSLTQSGAHPSWSRRLDESGAVQAAESQYVAFSLNQDLRVHRLSGSGGADAATLVSYTGSYPGQYVNEVEWLPQHSTADDRSWILFRVTTWYDASTSTSKLMMVEVDTSSWPVTIVANPVEATWAETSYPPGVSDDGNWACWAADDGASLRVAPLHWGSTTGDFIGIGTASSVAATSISGYAKFVAYGASLNADGTRAAVWAETSSGSHDLLLLDADGTGVASVGPGTKKRGVSTYGAKTSWEP